MNSLELSLAQPTRRFATDLKALEEEAPPRTPQNPWLPPIARYTAPGLPRRRSVAFDPAVATKASKRKQTRRRRRRPSLSEGRRRATIMRNRERAQEVAARLISPLKKRSGGGGGGGGGGVGRLAGVMEEKGDDSEESGAPGASSNELLRPGTPLSVVLAPATDRHRIALARKTKESTPADILKLDVDAEDPYVCVGAGGGGGGGGGGSGHEVCGVKCLPARLCLCLTSIACLDMVALALASFCGICSHVISCSSRAAHHTPHTERHTRRSRPGSPQSPMRGRTAPLRRLVSHPSISVMRAGQDEKSMLRAGSSAALVPKRVGSSAALVPKKVVLSNGSRGWYGRTGVNFGATTGGGGHTGDGGDTRATGHPGGGTLQHGAASGSTTAGGGGGGADAGKPKGEVQSGAGGSVKGADHKALVAGHKSDGAGKASGPGSGAGAGVGVGVGGAHHHHKRQGALADLKPLTVQQRMHHREVTAVKL